MKDFISYELAVKLKTLGFNWPCYVYIYTGDTGNNYDHYLEVKPSDSKDWNGKSDLCVSQPTFSQAFRWFREKYDLHYQLIPFFSDKESHAVDYYLALAQHRPPIQVKTFEEAELACLEKLIEIVEQTNAEMTDHGVYK
jgi:hypothetical protein